MHRYPLPRGGREDLVQPGSRIFFRSRYRTISLYIAKEYFISFGVAFFFFFTIFFVNQLLLLAEEILSRDVSARDVVMLVIYSLPAIVSFTFPFASLVGGLMAVGRLSADNEILAFRACGIPYRKMLYPLLAAGMFFSLVSFVMGDYFLPRGTISFGKLYREILYSNPALELDSYSVKHYQDATLVTGKVETGIIRDLTIFDTTEKGEQRVIIASAAKLREETEQIGVVGLELENVFGHVREKSRPGQFNYFTAESMIYNILLKDISFSLSSLTPREMSSIDVYREIREKKKNLQERRDEQARVLAENAHRLLYEYYTTAITEEALVDLSSRYEAYGRMGKKPITSKSLKIHQLELHKKIAIPFGCFAFVFFFFPAGTFSRKSGRSVGFGIGLIISVFYWAMLFGGQTLGLRMDFDPMAAMWLPNVVIVLVGIILYRWRMAR
jgi:lipopolysaccharide export system permease protein